MTIVAALVADRGEAELLLRDLVGFARVQCFDDAEALVRFVSTNRIDAVVAGTRNHDGTVVTPALSLLRAQRPDLPIVLYVEPTPARLIDLGAIARSVPAVEFALRPHHDLQAVLGPLLRAEAEPTAAEPLVQRGVVLAPPDLRHFFLACALKPSPRLRLGTLARWCRCSERTLRRRLRAAGQPSPSVVLGYCTALHAAWWLDVRGWPAKQVVGAMRFSHASALSRLLRQYAGRSVTDFREPGGFVELLKHFEDVLRGATQARARGRTAA